MTITITIDIHPDGGPQDVQLDQHMLALGYEKRTPTLREMARAAHDAGVEIDFSLTRQDAPVGEGVSAMTAAEAAAAAPEAPTRKRGEPSPGKKRRTAAEIAEDEAAEKAELDSVNNQVIPAISETPEDRQDPNNPEVVDDAETAAADAADEAAETAAAKTGLTLDDVRNASGAYAKKFGVAAAQADVRNLIGKPMVELTEGEFEGASKAINDAIDANPFERDVVGAEPAKTATRDDIRAALRAYALKYDGQNADPKNMPFTMEDGPKVFELVLGKKCDLTDDNGKPRNWAVKDLPEDPALFARAVAGIEEMTAKNPFKREVKVA